MNFDTGEMTYRNIATYSEKKIRAKRYSKEKKIHQELGCSSAVSAWLASLRPCILSPAP